MYVRRQAGSCANTLSDDPSRDSPAHVLRDRYLQGHPMPSTRALVYGEVEEAVRAFYGRDYALLDALAGSEEDEIIQQQMGGRHTVDP